MKAVMCKVFGKYVLEIYECNIGDKWNGFNIGGEIMFLKFLKRLRTSLWIVGGSILLGLGVIGIFLPLLPTTPFLLASAACYARGSKRFYSWLLNNRFFGEYVRNYRQGKGIPLKTKVFTLALLWITISTSAAIVSIWIIRIILMIIAVGVSIHLITLPTYNR